MNRRTVDITVDAYDAPMLAALAKRLVHIRSLGHADGAYLSWPESTGFEIAGGGMAVDAQCLKQARDWEVVQRGAANPVTTMLGEVAEALEAETDTARIYELLDVAAVCVRIASKMQRDLDAKGGE